MALRAKAAAARDEGSEGDEGDEGDEGVPCTLLIGLRERVPLPLGLARVPQLLHCGKILRTATPAWGTQYTHNTPSRPSHPSRADP